jgi:hypothetical protein
MVSLETLLLSTRVPHSCNRPVLSSNPTWTVNKVCVRLDGRTKQFESDDTCNRLRFQKKKKKKKKKKFESCTTDIRVSFSHQPNNGVAKSGIVPVNSFSCKYLLASEPKQLFDQFRRCCKRCRYNTVVRETAAQSPSESNQPVDCYSRAYECNALRSAQFCFTTTGVIPVFTTYKCRSD